ncbi:hypothetical protein CBR_g46812 [Chara braunii]|uniref:DUF4360 domain-containing protein n=1 Tax=Chara braunii TaxID=69332 RepID=A0A388M157_CHABU|nr:hypothetical protein CBR_g46812 [Chara braunii]|eukprot:GBG88245.1 hypothetical protein CBR_g46812 [Chara braunii]
MVVLLLLGLLQLAVPGLAQSPPSGTVKITKFTYSGSGCPRGSAEGVVSSDGQTLTLIFSKYTVSTPGSTSNRRKNCQVGVTLMYPTGFTFTLGTVTFRGYAQFEQGVKGTLAAAYYFSGIQGTVRVSRNLPPPVEGNFEFTDQFVTFVYQPCDRQPLMLNLNSEARVMPPPSPSKSAGLITVDSQDLSLRQLFRLRWKKC